MGHAISVTENSAHASAGDMCIIANIFPRHKISNFLSVVPKSPTLSPSKRPLAQMQLLRTDLVLTAFVNELQSPDLMPFVIVV